LADVVVDSVGKFQVPVEIAADCFPLLRLFFALQEMAVGRVPVAWFSMSSAQFDLPLTLQHLHMHPSRKISKLKAISIKLTPTWLRYFCLVTA
jgi:hypothetical protein